MQAQATVALTPFYEDRTRQLPAADVLGSDESSTKQARTKSWLWGFVAGADTVFALLSTRSTVLQELLTDTFDSLVNCDRAKIYGNPGRLQWCWGHLKRDFQALIEHLDQQVKRLDRDLPATDERTLQSVVPLSRREDHPS